MSWIETIPYGRSTGRLRALYDRVIGPHGEIDNILKLHALRPHTLEGHMTLYKAVLHHRGNALPRELLECIGIRVSVLNRCDYCVAHHAEGLRRLVDDAARSDRLLRALESGTLEAAFEPVWVAAIRYAETLTREPWAVAEAHVDELRAVGFDDAEILEINQVAAYFAYANRTVLGLGATTAGDVLGLSPADAADPASWGHR